MHIELKRTFSKYAEPQPEDEDVDWHSYFSTNHHRLTWDDLLAKRVAVVLGEAGIGKTIELQAQARRLRTDGRHAFFVPLNALKNREDWSLALGEALTAFLRWQTTSDEAIFFLDAVDEARLHSHVDFSRAVWIVRQALEAKMQAVCIVISSRVTDWTVPEVHTAVTTQLLAPIRHAIAQSAGLNIPVDEQGANAGRLGDDDEDELFVVTLDALSRDEAHRCARFFNLQDESAFWTAVEDSDYIFMASRPLDLRWMVELWNQRKVFGTYTELLDANVGATLIEINPNYQQAGKVLAETRLREGARELAAAMEFGGYAFIAVSQAAAVGSRVLDPSIVLDTWRVTDVRLLLSTALFDEASFDRVKFHHRSVREFLAAQWVQAKLVQGVPFGRLQQLFARQVDGELTLLSARRSVLSWLAAINVVARAWVVAHFPEILLHEGDPQSWDQRSADLAFQAVIADSDTRPRINDWHKSRSEYLRISRAVSPGLVSAVLQDQSAPSQSRSIAYRLAIHGKLQDCAGPAFEIFRDTHRSEWERTSALAVLEVAGFSHQHDEILADLESGALTSNTLVASALSCVDWKALTPSRLEAIFSDTQSEGDFASGPMYEVVRRELLPDADLASATLLLTTTLNSLPKPPPNQSFSRFPSKNQPERAWILHAFPYCLERVLELTVDVNNASLPLLIEAVGHIETKRYHGFTDREQFQRLHTLINQMYKLRWALVLEIAKVDKDRLVWNTACIVTLQPSDLPELTLRSQDESVSVAEQEIWLYLGVEVTFKIDSGRERSKAFRALCASDQGQRLLSVLERYKQWSTGSRARRTWAVEDRKRKEQERNDRAQAVNTLQSRSLSIADGSDFRSLRHLLTIAHRSNSSDDDGSVNVQLIASQYGREIADLFVQGLKSYWKRTSPPDPSEYPGGQVPWEGLMALAGLTLSVRDGLEFSRLSENDVVSAARIAVWALPGPPHWFESLHNAWPEIVTAALTPWIFREAQDSHPGTGVRGAYSLAINCPSSIRKRLLTSVSSLVLNGDVKNDEVLRKLVPTLYGDALMSETQFDAVCERELNKARIATGQVSNLSWLRIWADARLRSAWEWFKNELLTSTDEPSGLAANFAISMASAHWANRASDETLVALKLEIADLLRHYTAVVKAKQDAIERVSYPRMTQMLYEIARGFVGIHGTLGRKALQQMLASENDAERRSDIAEYLHEHADLEASTGQQWDIGRLRKLHSPFDSEPQTEAQLYEQVVARLEEIRTQLENGPFSDRALFDAGTPEKHLQRWLAAKLWDTQNRRFSVHREEEVDDDKKTDIQLSCPSGKVCVELKPVDADRGYSANSLTDTLQTQIVGQYLKGYNSSRGILVLIQLDRKAWHIPDGAKNQSFEELVQYLQLQADAIKENTPGVNDLLVFPMRCVI